MTYDQDCESQPVLRRRSNFSDEEKKRQHELRDAEFDDKVTNFHVCPLPNEDAHPRCDPMLPSSILDQFWPNVCGNHFCRGFRMLLTTLTSVLAYQRLLGMILVLASQSHCGILTILLHFLS